MKSTIKWGCFFPILSLIIIIIVGGIIAYFLPIQNIVKSDNNNITVSKYTLYQKYVHNDSTILNYPQDRFYDGTLIERKEVCEFVGLPGKGGHYVTYNELIIEYNDGKRLKESVGNSTVEKILSKPLVVGEYFYPRYRVCLVY